MLNINDIAPSFQHAHQAISELLRTRDSFLAHDDPFWASRLTSGETFDRSLVLRPLVALG
jgi:hypothetical protein